MGSAAEQSAEELGTGAGWEAAKMAPAFLEAEPQTHLLFPFEQQSEFAFSVILNLLQDTCYVPGTVQSNRKQEWLKYVFGFKWFRGQYGK